MFSENSVFFFSQLLWFFLASQLYRPKNHGDFFLFMRDYFRPIIMPMQKISYKYIKLILCFTFICVYRYITSKKSDIATFYFFFLLHLKFPYYVYIKRWNSLPPSSTKKDNKIRLIKSIWILQYTYYLKWTYTEIMHASLLIRPFNYIPLKISTIDSGEFEYNIVYWRNTLKMFN